MVSCMLFLKNLFKMKFTVKDFISYCDVCMCCGGKTKFSLERTILDDPYASVQNCVPVSLKDRRGNIRAELMISYADSKRLYLDIYIKSNEYLASNKKLFDKFINENNLYMSKRCDNCKNCTIQSSIMSFGKYISPVCIYTERLFFEEEEYDYDIYSSYKDKKTHIMVTSEDAAKWFNIDVPFLPLYKFKNKQNLLNKIKTYMLFS